MTSRSSGAAPAPRLSLAQRLVDLLAGRADRAAGLRALRHREDLAAQGLDHGAHDGALGDLVLLDVVEDLVGVAGVGVADVRPLQDVGTAHDVTPLLGGDDLPSMMTGCIPLLPYLPGSSCPQVEAAL